MMVEMLNKAKKPRMDTGPSSHQMAHDIGSPKSRTTNTVLANHAKGSEISSEVIDNVPGAAASKPTEVNPGPLSGSTFLAMHQGSSSLSPETLSSVGMETLPSPGISRYNTEVQIDTTEHQQVLLGPQVKASRVGTSQRQLEYIDYIAKFPKLIPSDQDKLKTWIQSSLGFEDFKDV